MGPTSLTPKLRSDIALTEVLTAMLVPATSVLALLAVQLRTVSNVHESENQTTAAQITQNLIEGILTNPTLSKEIGTVGDKTSRYKKSYGAYITPSSERLRDSKQTNEFKEKMTKAQLAQAQIAQLKADLAKALPEAQVFLTIYKDSSGAKPTYEKGFNAKCDGKGDTIIVKVLWLQNVEEGNSVENLNTSGRHAAYTYQLRAKDQQ